MVCQERSRLLQVARAHWPWKKDERGIFAHKVTSCEIAISCLIDDVSHPGREYAALLLGLSANLAGTFDYILHVDSMTPH